MGKPPDPDTPFVPKPDQIDDKPENGLICFLDSTRQCGADCMAYQTEPPVGPDYRGQQWGNCMLLVNAHRVGKHLTILASSADALIKRAADQARTSQQPPPPPR